MLIKATQLIRRFSQRIIVSHKSKNQDVVWSLQESAKNVDFATLKDYSTSEVDTGVKWIDGSHIYQKTINFGSLPNTDAKSVNIGTTIKRLIKLEGVAYRSSDGTNFLLPFVASQGGASYQYSIEIEATTSQLVIRTGADRSNLTAYVTLYYTK